jgi:hypothetical protein
MAIDFPASPTNGQTFTSGSVTYTYDGTKWTAETGSVSLSKIEVGNTKAEIVDTGSDGRFVVTTEGSERLRVNSAGEIGLAGANYGTSGQVLTSGGTGAAPTWKAGGKILQVVSATTTGYTSISATTYTDTGLTASITPSSSASKVLVLVQQSFAPTGAAAGVGYGNQTNAGLRLLRGSTNLIDPASDSGGRYTFGIAATGTLVAWGIISLTYLDSPATTSATTYKTQAAKGTSGMHAIDINNQGNISTITLLEVAA